MNFLDYAFLQNAVDEHDKANKAESASIPWKEIQPLYTDVRNILQSMAEVIAFDIAQPAVGEKYLGYLFGEAHNLTVKTWMSQPLMTARYGKSWTRWTRYGKTTFSTVYATDKHGRQWRGTATSSYDAIVLRRIK